MQYTVCFFEDEGAGLIASVQSKGFLRAVKIARTARAVRDGILRPMPGKAAYLVDGPIVARCKVGICGWENRRARLITWLAAL